MVEKQPTKSAQTSSPAQPSPAAQKQGMSTGAKVGIGLGAGCLVIIIIIIVATGCGKVKKEVEKAVSQTPSPTPTIQYTFDVPALVGKNIDEIRTILGEPIDGALKEPTQEQIDLGAKEWDNTFKKDDKELLVTYNPTTRKVIDFFVSTDDSSGKTQDKAHLLELGNLKDNDSKYSIKFVDANKYPGYYTGVIATPK